MLRKERKGRVKLDLKGDFKVLDGYFQEKVRRSTNKENTFGSVSNNHGNLHVCETSFWFCEANHM